MNELGALGKLPRAYAEALLMREQGQTVEMIAHRLEVDVATVEPMLRLAEAKLAKLLARQASSETQAHPRKDGKPTRIASRHETPRVINRRDGK